MRPPDGAEISAPEFPPKMDWLNVAFLRMDKLRGPNAVLIEFFDTARINSHRTLPYLQGWDARYADHGLRMIGVHSPGYSFGRDPEVAARRRGAGREPPGVLDPDFEVWRLYGNQGWPGRYLFDRAATALHPLRRGRLRAPPRRPSSRCSARSTHDLEPPSRCGRCGPRTSEGALLEPQTADIALPADRERLELTGDWTDGEDWIEAAAAGRHGRGAFQRRRGVGGAVGRRVEPGLYETDGTVTAEQPGLRLHGFQFTPAPP